MNTNLIRISREFKSVFIVFAFASAAMTAKAKPMLSKSNENTPSLMTMALNEVNASATDVKKANSAQIQTDNQITGALTLEDPKKEILERDFKYLFSMKLSNLKLQGQISNDVNAQLNLSQSKASMGPALEFGIFAEALHFTNFKVGFGLNAGAAYFNSANNMTLQSGYVVDDARLVTYMGYLNPYLSVRSRWLPRFTYSVGPQNGYLNVLQSSKSEYANFSANTRFNGLTQRIDFKLTQKWSALVEYQKIGSVASTKDSKISLDDSALIGVKTLW